MKGKDMKKILCLPCALLLFASCSTAQRTASDRPAHREAFAQDGMERKPDPRVDGQRAREAGLADDRWAIQHKLLGAEQEAPTVTVKAEPIAQGAASPGAGESEISSSGGGVETMDHADIELRKEELVVGKREVSNGGVLIRTTVQTENVSQPIELRREEYTIERVAADNGRDSQSSSPAGANTAFQNREIYIPLTREEAVAGKRTLLTEIVKVGKRIETDHETVTKPVRTEDVEIVKNPDLSDRRFSSVPRKPAPSAGQEVTQAQPGTSPREQSDSDTLKLEKEDLVVGKREVDNGGVLLKKVVRTHDASQALDLRREEFSINRTPGGDQPIDSADFTPREIKIDLIREEPVVGTRDYLAETVRVRKQVQKDAQTVSGTVRKESLEIVKNPGQNAAIDSASQAGQGGTGSSSVSGVSSTSESSSSQNAPK
jgi:uncharacterized protein (TIGR02271 family)